MSEKLTVSCSEFRPLHRNTLRGFAAIRIAELKLTIHDVALHQHPNGARWAAMPSKPMIDRNGVAKRGAEGKIEYVTLFEFEGRGVRDAFSQAVVRAVLELDPHAFEYDEAAP